MAFIAVLGIIIGMAALIGAVIAVGAILNGFVLTILWGWFIVPTFHLSPLSIPAAIGIAMVTGYLTHQYAPDVEEKERSDGEKILRATLMIVLRPLAVLGIGYVVHLYM